MQNKKNIRQYNKNRKAHGCWEVYHRTTNNLFFKALYVNGIEYGYNITRYEWPSKSEIQYYAR